MKLHNEQEAIKQAIEGGFMYPYSEYDNLSIQFDTERVLVYDHDRLCQTRSYEECFCDPKFWQSLGKARGWEYCKLHSFEGSSEGCLECAVEKKNLWKIHALRYFETRLSGGNLKNFWESL